MNQQLVTMAVGLGLSQVARRLDLDTPERLWGIRALYLATNVIIFALYLYIAAKVSRTISARSLLFFQALKLIWLL